MCFESVPDSKVHGANMGLTWDLSAPDGPHVGPTNLAVRGIKWCHITYNMAGTMVKNQSDFQFTNNTTCLPLAGKVGLSVTRVCEKTYNYDNWTALYYTLKKQVSNITLLSNDARVVHSYWWLNSSFPSGTYMCQSIRSALVKIMACQLFSTKPLSKPMLGYYKLDP